MSSSPPPEAEGTRTNWLHRLVPVTLTARLVVVVVLLVALVGGVVAVATALATRSILVGQRDSTLHASLQRELDRDDQPGGLGSTQFCPTGNLGNVPGRLPFGQMSGSITVRPGCAYRVTSTIPPLTTAQEKAVEQVPADGDAHTIDVDGLGSMRVIATSSVIVGVPIKDVEHTVHNLVLWELVLTATGVLIAGLVGSELVRRTLRPLRVVTQTAQSVTGQHLAEGDITIEERVPERYAIPGSEAGDVGAALNTLLDHVDDALSARHRSEQQVRQFVADASHELRTPLSTIHGYAELSRRTPDDAGQLSGAMAKVETEAHRMSGLVEDMLLLARLDAGRPLARDEVDVTRLLLEAVADARVVAPDHRWKLELPDEPVQVVGDESRLHQVVTNLLNNARKHTPEGTTVTVSAAVVDDRNASIRVHDDGPGLPEDLVPHAFERFTRGDHSRTRASGGAGLGLSLVSAIVEAHHGRVELTSKPGDTTFTVLLPRS